MLWAGTVLCAALAAGGLLAPRRRTRYALLAAALVLAPVLVVGDNWDSARVAEIRDRPAISALAVVLALVAIYLAALLARARPALLVPALVATLPFRVPVDLGAGSANLLLPLYAVIAAGVVAGLLGGDQRRAAAERGPLRWIGAVLGAVIVLYALQSARADEISPAVQDVGFFLVPFAALFALLAEAPLDGAALRRVLWVLAVEGVVFALVAGYQYAARDLFWNGKVIAGNEAHQYFRVNSLFYDPNILGRYLALTMVALAAVVAYGRRRVRPPAAAAFALLLAALVISFSQSSTIALIAGMLVLVAARWGLVQGAAAGLAVVALLAASVALISDGGLSDEGASGRKGLIDGGIEIAADAPVLGVGSGAFATAFRDRFGAAEGFAVESHTTPVTILAEQGAVGLIAYLALLAVTIGGLVLALAPRLTAPARGSPLAAGLTAIYAVLLVHSLGYAAFLTDPATWAVLAIAAGTLAPAGAGAPHRAPGGSAQPASPRAGAEGGSARPRAAG